MLINKVEKLINEFLENNSFRSIYNEISLQFELGFFLKENLKNHNVEFERNINNFYTKKETFNRKNFTKHEIDIAIYDETKQEKCAIELKYPRKKAYSRRIDSFLKDIDFVEELKQNLNFQGGFVLTFIDKSEGGFYKGKYQTNDMKAIFRSSGETLYRNRYSIRWINYKNNLKYYLLKI